MWALNLLHSGGNPYRAVKINPPKAQFYTISACFSHNFVCAQWEYRAIGWEKTLGWTASKGRQVKGICLMVIMVNNNTISDFSRWEARLTLLHFCSSPPSRLRWCKWEKHFSFGLFWVIAHWAHPPNCSCQPCKSLEPPLLSITLVV